jgi:hypothetical protein
VSPGEVSDRRTLPSRKDGTTVLAWAARYEELALTGVRSREVTERIGLHLQRFAEYLEATYGDQRLGTVVRRDVVGWRDSLVASGLGPSTVNNHLASLAWLCGWVAAQAAEALPGGNPTSGVGTRAGAAGAAGADAGAGPVAEERRRSPRALSRAEGPAQRPRPSSARSRAREA